MVIAKRPDPVPDMKPPLRSFLSLAVLVIAVAMPHFALAQATLRVEPFDEANQNPSSSPLERN